MGKTLRLILWGLFLLTGTFQVQAQTDSTAYAPIDENKFANTYWKYQFMTQGTDAKMHEADPTYEFYVYFRFDNVMQQHLHGKLSTAKWKLNKERTQLYYPYKNVKWWKVVSFTKESLVLEFGAATGISFRYHFKQVKDSETPFIKDPYILPPAEVKQKKKGGFMKKLLTGNTGKDRHARAKDNKPKKVLLSDPKPIVIKIELIGGGYYGGVDPVMKDYLTINTDGKVLKEIQTSKKGIIKTSRKITRKEVENLMTFINQKNFFGLDNSYDCNDDECIRRKTKAPVPIPLRIAITYGDKRKLIIIAIWGKDKGDTRYITYPPEIDQIIDAIRRVAG